MAVYGGSALVAAAVGVVDAAPLARHWGLIAAGSYAVGVVVSWMHARTGAARASRRLLVTIAVFVGAALVPLGLEMSWRAEAGLGTHAKSETVVTEESARSFVRAENPYAVDHAVGPLERFPPGVDEHVPYLPGNVLFGLSRPIAGDGPPGDARIAFALVFVGALVLALRLSGAEGGRQLRAFIVIAVSPLGARYVVSGGNDLPVIAIMLLALVLLERRRPVSAGLAAGSAAAVKLTAWPLLPFLIVAARHPDGSPARSRATATALGVLALAIAPFALWDLGAMWEDVILYPLGLTSGGTPASSPTVGGLLAGWFPGARGAIAVAGGCVVAGVMAFLLIRHPPASARTAARQVAVVLACAFVLATAGRFGYLLYVVDLWLFSSWILQPGGEPRSPTPGKAEGPSRAAPAQKGVR